MRTDAIAVGAKGSQAVHPRAIARAKGNVKS
jgi:hypothetical protein